MADNDTVNEVFAPPPANALPQDVMGELQSILRIHSTTPQELFFKWEAYTIRMGLETTKVEMDSVRAFKKDLQETLERESRAKVGRSAERKSHATPKSENVGYDAFGILDGIVPATPVPTKSRIGSVKRKAPNETPPVPKFQKMEGMSSPVDGRSDARVTGSTAPFSDRKGAGQVVETLNDHVPAVQEVIAPAAEPRAKLTANTDIKKFYYKPMSMHLSEGSEVLDDRIDAFQAIVQQELGLEDNAFGSAGFQSTNEIVAIGRIACESLEGKLNAASIVLETSRRTGAGLRVPLKMEAISKDFFPGQIVALRGINASGSYFSVREIIDIPLMAPVVSSVAALDASNQRLGSEEEGEESGATPLNIMLSSGPYTADDNLAFEPFNALCEKAAESYADVLILVGPFLDIEHPQLASGDFDLPDDASFEPDRATLDDVFRILIGAPLKRLAQNNPSITIILIPSARDAVNKHVSWPQEPFEKKPLGLPKQARIMSNPVTFSLNEILIAVTASDILYDLRREEVNVGKPKGLDLLSRLPRHLIEQRHFYPLYPPVDRTSLPQTGIESGIAIGMPLDASYLKLGEWLDARPDVLITPSALPPFAKISETVLVVNPGPISKRKGPGTYAQIAVHPRKVTNEERSAGDSVRHHVFERARVDVVKI